MNAKSPLLALVAAFAIVGCASVPAPSGPRFSALAQPSPTHATVYFIRTSHPLGRAVWPNVLIDGKVVANLTNGTFTVIDVAPGIYTVRTRMDPTFLLSADWDSEAKLEAVAGRRYFFDLYRQVETRRGLAFVGSVAYPTSSMNAKDHQLRVVPEDHAIQLLTGLSFDKPLAPVVP